MVDAAEACGKSVRWLQNWLRDHPVDAHGKTFFSQVGRTKMFRPDDIRRILDAMMVAPCPSRSTRPAPVKHRTAISEARTSESLWTEARALLEEPLQSSNGKKSNN